MARLVLTGIERFVPQETIDAAIGPLAGSLFARHPGAGELAEELRPTVREQAVLAALEQPRRLEELLPIAALPLAELSRQIWGLAMLGLVIPADRLLLILTRRPEPPPVAAAPPANALPPMPTVLPAEEAARDPRSSRHCLLQAARTGPVRPARGGRRHDHRRDSRALLRLRPPVRPLAIRGARAPERGAGGRRALRCRRARLRPAERPKEREALRSARLSPPGATHRTAGPTPASVPIQTDLLDPELQYKKGRALKEGQRWSQALQFDFAADCDPQNGAYRAEAAHCRFLLAPTTMGAKALDALKEAQRIDPESITPYLYAGEIAAHLGKFDDAETYLRSAAKRLGPTDRRVLDALRDLAKKRKK